VVRTAGFHPVNRGSIPLRATDKKIRCRLSRHLIFLFAHKGNRRVF